MTSSICGTIHLIEETKEYGERGFRKRRIVLIQSQGKYDNYIPLDFIQDMCDEADNLLVGMEVTVGYRVSGRKWVNPDGDEKYFLNLEVVDIMDVQEMEAGAQPTLADDDDDTPF